MGSGTGEWGNGTVGHGALDVRMRLGNAIADFDWHWREGADFDSTAERLFDSWATDAVCEIAGPPPCAVARGFWLIYLSDGGKLAILPMRRVVEIDDVEERALFRRAMRSKEGIRLQQLVRSAAGQQPCGVIVGRSLIYTLDWNEGMNEAIVNRVVRI